MLAGSTPNIATLRDRASSGKADHLIKLIGRLFPTPPFHPGSIFGVDFCLDPDTIQSGPTNKSCRSQQENPARDLSRQRRFRSRHFKIPTIKPKKKKKKKKKKEKRKKQLGNVTVYLLQITVDYGSASFSCPTSVWRFQSRQDRSSVPVRSGDHQDDKAAALKHDDRWNESQSPPKLPSRRLGR